MKKLTKHVVKTLAFFDNFNHPLTLQELHRFLWKKKIDFSSLKENIEEIKNNSLVDFSDGFFCLRDSKEKVATRQKRVKFIKEKTKIAKKAACKLTWIPFIKAIFVCNTLAAKNPDEGSDIDFFIVTESSRVWLVRFFTNLVLKLFRLRVDLNSNKVKDKICLTFFASEEKMNLSEFSISQPDIYLIYWIQQLYPLYDPDNYYEKLITENSWIEDYTPNLSEKKEVISKDKVEPGAVSSCVKKVLSAMWQGSYGNLLENQSRKLQEQRLKSYLGDDYENNEPNVIIKEEVIKLHENDNREEYKRKWKQTYREYLG